MIFNQLNDKADFPISRLGSDGLLTVVNSHFLFFFFLEKENERGSLKIKERS